MGGLILVLALVCLALLSMLLIRHRRMQRLSRQAEAFLDGTEMPLPCALSDGSAARLQNALSRLENALLLSREQTKQEAKRSADLLTDISHQLKTPLASLQLFLELDSGPHLEEEQAQLERMQTLISNLLRLERLCADGYTFHFASHDLYTLAENCWQPLGLLYPEKQFLISGSAVLHCDEIWMGEAITNLLKNACEHTPARGRVSMELTQFPQEVRLRIRDNGGGVAPEVLPRIFDRFYHGDHPDHGAGIGLSIVKEIVWRHHGSVSAENIPGGLQFTLYFPRLEESLAKS